MIFRWWKFVFSLIIASTLGCGVMYVTIGGSTSASLQTYEYVYFGDANNPALAGYSINTTSGVLTPVNVPSQFGGIILSKISNSVQLITAFGSPEATYSISPSTGMLTPVTGSGAYSTQSTGFQPSIASSSGRYLYSIDGGGGNGWITSLDSNGNFVSSTETASFPGPVTSAASAVLSPDGNYVYFYDPAHSAMVGYSTTGGALNLITGANIGNGQSVGDKTYGLTLLPTPNAGAYTFTGPGNNGVPYLDAPANIIYFVYQGTSGQNCWSVPYKIGSDGSLTAGALLNIGTSNGQNGGVSIGDATGTYLFLVPFGNVGINSYSIGTNGALTLASGPVLTGQNIDHLIVNAENSLLILGDQGAFDTASINPSNGVLTPVTTLFVSPCPTGGPIVLDPTEHFIYLGEFGNICGVKMDSAGNIGTISGQTYPLTISGAGTTFSAFATKITVP